MIEAWAHHDMTKPIGSVAAGNLRLKDTPTGLTYELDLPQGNSDADNLVSLANSGIIGGTSIGFGVNQDDVRWTRDGGENIAEVLRADLSHISPVVTPAYPQTSAMLRSMITDHDKVDEYGIDLNLLAKIFVAAKRGLIISDNEMEVARRAIELLRGRIQTPRLERAMNQVSRLLI